MSNKKLNIILGNGNKEKRKDLAKYLNKNSNHFFSIIMEDLIELLDQKLKSNNIWNIINDDIYIKEKILFSFSSQITMFVESTATGLEFEMVQDTINFFDDGINKLIEDFYILPFLWNENDKYESQEYPDFILRDSFDKVGFFALKTVTNKVTTRVNNRYVIFEENYKKNSDAKKDDYSANSKFSLLITNNIIKKTSLRLSAQDKNKILVKLNRLNSITANSIFSINSKKIVVKTDISKWIKYVEIVLEKDENKFCEEWIFEMILKIKNEIEDIFLNIPKEKEKVKGVRKIKISKVKRSKFIPIIEEESKEKFYKTRTLYMYEENEDGNKLSRQHSKLKSTIDEFISTLNNEHSFAYYKSSEECKKNTFLSLKRHLDNNSRFFLKLDIKDFFGSIDHSLLLDKFDSEYLREYLMISNSLIDNDNKGIPQGFPASPSISNLYMNQFDLDLASYLSDLSNKIIYTRYSDDILISFGDSKNLKNINLIYEKIILLLSKIGLKLNNKTRFIDLKNGSLRYLGVNVLNSPDGVYWTLGRTFEKRVNYYRKNINESEYFAKILEGLLSYEKSFKMFLENVQRYKIINDEFKIERLEDVFSILKNSIYINNLSSSYISLRTNGFSILVQFKKTENDIIETSLFDYDDNSNRKKYKPIDFSEVKKPLDGNNIIDVFRHDEDPFRNVSKIKTHYDFSKNKSDFIKEITYVIKNLR